MAESGSAGPSQANRHRAERLLRNPGPGTRDVRPEDRIRRGACWPTLPGVRNTLTAERIRETQLPGGFEPLKIHALSRHTLTPISALFIGAGSVWHRRVGREPQSSRER